MCWPVTRMLSDLIFLPMACRGRSGWASNLPLFMFMKGFYMLRRIPHKGHIISFVIFMWIFGSSGLWWAGLFCWLHFTVFIMPKSWRI